MKNEITPQYSKALELHNKILVSAQLMTQNLWDMCSGLKEMRDGKLYKELGYQNYEDYCQSEFNMNRSNAHKYISIIENINPENVSTSKHFGVSKLYLLSTLSQPEQEKITAENDVESMTVKELEAEIKNLKMSNEQKKSQLQSLNDRLNSANENVSKYRSGLHIVEAQNKELEERIEELEARPVEVAVAEPPEDVRQLKLTIRNLEHTTEQQLERLQDEHLRDVQTIHQKHGEELKEALRDQKREYEARIESLEDRLRQAEAEDTTHDVEQELFKIYLTAAHDAMFKLMGFSSNATDKSACFAQIKSLLEEFNELNDELIYGRN